MTILQDFIKQIHDEHGILLNLTAKKVKNINFRLRGDTLFVSYPHHLSNHKLIDIIVSRLDWVKSHQKIPNSPKATKTKPMLWGKPLDISDYLAKQGMSMPTLSHDERWLLEIYRAELAKKIPILTKKWQPIVGQCANEIRLKRMRTRWGTCNTRDRRVWLSLYLVAYPYECTEYVFVHELCHLIHANHSKDFWDCVKVAMPDYQYWHDLLKQSSIQGLQMDLS